MGKDKKDHSTISLSLKNILHPKEYLKNLWNGKSNLNDADYGIYGEEYFHKVFTLERRRTERSRKPFLLMLINISELLESTEDVQVLNKIKTVLISNTREVDIKGWYKLNHIIGIIFTEPEDIDVNFVQNKINKKLSEAIGNDLANKITFSLYLFPQTLGKKHEKNIVNLDKKLSTYIEERGSGKKSIIVKRTLDIIGSILGILVFSPFILTIPILIKFTSNGPVFFRQERLGLSGQTFTFLKFRSMYVNNDSTIHQNFIKNYISIKGEDNEREGSSNKDNVYKIQNDPRVTPLGRLLRKMSLDEIPQFFNVLKGDMSLVGPRPPIPYELEHYDLWHQRRVLELKPGITGVWQVYGRSATTFDEMVRMDINYINRWSLILDIKLLFKTPWVMLSGKGAH